LCLRQTETTGPPCEFPDLQFSQERDILQPAAALFASLPPLLADFVSGWRVVRSAMAMPMLRSAFCATCGVTTRFPHSATKSLVSYPLSAPKVTASHPVSVPPLPAPRPARLCHWRELGIDDQVMRFSASRFPRGAAKQPDPCIYHRSRCAVGAESEPVALGWRGGLCSPGRDGNRGSTQRFTTSGCSHRKPLTGSTIESRHVAHRWQTVELARAKYDGRALRSANRKRSVPSMSEDLLVRLRPMAPTSWFNPACWIGFDSRNKVETIGGKLGVGSECPRQCGGHHLRRR